MNKISLAALALALIFSAHAQTTVKEQELVAEIKSIDQAELEAFLAKDIGALEKYWSEDFTVNAPNNKILKRKDVLDLLRNGILDYESYERHVEVVLPHGDTVTVMGSETVKSRGKEQTVQRRATNIWMKQNGKWQLLARHASIICPN